MLKDFYECSLQFIKTTGMFLAERSKEIAGPTVMKLTSETADRFKQVYRNNKELVISVSVAATVYLIMREKKEKKPAMSFEVEKKKTAKKSVIKSFISQRSQSEEEDDPTMVTKNEWSIEHRQVKSDQFFSEDEEEEEEEEGRDKIFFQMYRGYQDFKE